MSQSNVPSQEPAPAVAAPLPIPRWRIWLVAVVLMAMALALVGRFAQLQVVSGVERGYEFLQEQGDNRMVRTLDVRAERGMITDRNGDPLAVSTPVRSIWVDPPVFLATLIKKPERLGLLAEALQMPKADLKAKLEANIHRRFVYLKRRLPPIQAEPVLKLDYTGVGGQWEYRRFYPAGEVTAHVLGLTDSNDAGQEGIELAYDEWLRGQMGRKQILKDLKGRILKDLRMVEPMQKGNDLALSLDLRLQYLAYRELKAAVKRTGANSASAVVLDIATGEVLAMVNQPSFNPNDRGSLKPQLQRNRALTDQFEPGSTVKPLTVVAALESGQYQPDSMVDTNPGTIRIGRKTLLDPVNYGVIDVTKILTKSSQVGITKLAMSLEPEVIRDVFYRVGLGQDTGLGFPGESTGILPMHQKWRPIERATFAFGHGLSTTTMQLAQAYAVLAGNGIKRPTSLLKVDQIPAGEQVVDSTITKQVLAMLETVTQKGGTGKRAKVAAYRVAGKTGTVHKVGSRGYEASHYIALFAGVAPVENPRFATVVMVDDPKGNDYYGGLVAAPVFSKIASAALRINNVPPDSPNPEALAAVGGSP